MSAVIGVVDDDSSVLRALTRLLGTAGFTVRTFGSAEAFLAQDHSGIDCLLLDVHLGGLSGFDVQERLVGAHASIPIIFITAFDDPVTRERALKGGAVAYLPKPFDEQSLLGAIESALGRG